MQALRTFRSALALGVSPSFPVAGKSRKPPQLAAVKELADVVEKEVHTQVENNPKRVRVRPLKAPCEWTCGEPQIDVIRLQASFSS